MIYPFKGSTGIINRVNESVDNPPKASETSWIICITYTHGTRTCIKRKKIDYGKFFDFCADKYICKRIPKDENPSIKGF